MSDFEIIDSCDVEVVERNRKPKYTTKPWEYKNAQEEYQYYKTLQRSYKRRHGDIETPYDHHIDQRIDYAKEMELVFPIQLHNLEISIEDAIIVKTNTSYCRICCEYVNVDDISEDNSEVCDNCELHAFTCTFCNETMSTEYMRSEYAGVSLCLDCSYDEEKVHCDYCGEIVDKQNSVDIDAWIGKRTYCVTCLPEIERVE